MQTQTEALQVIQTLSSQFPDWLKTGTFLMVCSGETYFTEVVKGEDMLRRIMTNVNGDDPSFWATDEIKSFAEQLEGEDYWRFGLYDRGDSKPTEWETDIGETDRIRLFRMTHLD